MNPKKIKERRLLKYLREELFANDRTEVSVYELSLYIYANRRNLNRALHRLEVLNLIKVDFGKVKLIDFIKGDAKPSKQKTLEVEEDGK